MQEAMKKEGQWKSRQRKREEIIQNLKNDEFRRKWNN